MLSISKVNLVHTVLEINNKMDANQMELSCCAHWNDAKLKAYSAYSGARIPKPNYFQEHQQNNWCTPTSYLEEISFLSQFL